MTILNDAKRHKAKYIHRDQHSICMKGDMECGDK
jgi:hypothetical protein